ncbi:hypothetical protein OZD63_05355 [Wolbachia endosymbiont of Drosophila leontia]|nr:hypothetical protein [Wolbachia endosymbiont of Drosophila leontia]
MLEHQKGFIGVMRFLLRLAAARDATGWLCCIASYDGLKIKKMENISSLLFWYL